MEFEKFISIPRLNRDMIITEKIDGTNAQVCIVREERVVELYHEAIEKGVPYSDFLTGFRKKCIATTKHPDLGTVYVLAGSRIRWLTIDDDNQGFAKWVWNNVIQLAELGEGRHYGEWWGQGIGRKYGMLRKIFSLFNTLRWFKVMDSTDPNYVWLSNTQKHGIVIPECCNVVPVLYHGMFDTNMAKEVMADLEATGSHATLGIDGSRFEKPEGVVVYHIPGNFCLKATIEKDEGKGKKK